MRYFLPRDSSGPWPFFMKLLLDVFFIACGGAEGASQTMEGDPDPIGWRGGRLMSEVKVGKNESLESALRRFKRQIQKAGVLSEARRHEHYEKPSVRRKKKSEAARKKKK